MTPVDRIRERWSGVGRWHQRECTPWGSKVVHVEWGEVFVGTHFHTTPPSDKWAQVACERAEERREAMSRSAYLVAHAPTDIQVLLAEIDHLNARLAATPPRTPTLDEIVEAIRSYGAQSEAPDLDQGSAS